MDEHQAGELLDKFAILVSNQNIIQNEEAKACLIDSIIKIFTHTPSPDLITKIDNLANEEREDLKSRIDPQSHTALDKYLEILNTKYPQLLDSQNIEEWFTHLDSIKSHKPSIEQFIEILE